MMYAWYITVNGWTGPFLHYNILNPYYSWADSMTRPNAQGIILFTNIWATHVQWCSSESDPWQEPNAYCTGNKHVVGNATWCWWPILTLYGDKTWRKQPYCYLCLPVAWECCCTCDWQSAYGGMHSVKTMWIIKTVICENRKVPLESINGEGEMRGNHDSSVPGIQHPYSNSICTLLIILLGFHVCFPPRHNTCKSPSPLLSFWLWTWP